MPKTAHENSRHLAGQRRGKSIDTNSAKREVTPDMFVLKTCAELSLETKEMLRAEFKKHTGEDCIILSHGLELDEIRLKKEQPLWRRLFRRS